MQFIDLGRQQARIREDVEAAIRTVLDHGKYIMGPEIGELEKRLADFAGTRHAVTCGSGTDALVMALMALGVGPGHAVFAPAASFIATTEAASLLGATPVFVDVTEGEWNMDPEGLDRALEALSEHDDSLYPLPYNHAGLTPGAVIPVDLFGLPARLDEIEAVAAKYGVPVVEDAAQGFGARLRTDAGERVCGSFGAFSCTSFFPAKPLGCYGDGGAILTNDDDAAEILRSIRVHGQGSGDKNHNVRVGLNARMDTMQAAILLHKLAIFPEEVELRQSVAERYLKQLSTVDGLTLQTVPDGMTSTWAQFCMLAENSEARERLRAALKDADIPTAVYYPTPLHRQPVYAGLGYGTGSLPVAEQMCARIFAVPMHPYMDASDVDFVVQSLTSALNGAR